MTLTEVCIIVWHDLAAPTLVGIATGLFLGWWHSQDKRGGRTCRPRGSMRRKSRPRETSRLWCGPEVVTYNKVTTQPVEFRAEIAFTSVRVLWRLCHWPPLWK
ncbi:type I toxin-antitoxin system toxin Ldr family protein [Shigella flexneri]